jgi:hypothetical protein
MAREWMKADMHEDEVPEPKTSRSPNNPTLRA